MTRWPDGPSCSDIGRKTFPFASKEEAAIRICSAARVSGKSTESSRPSNGECHPFIHSVIFDFTRRNVARSTGTCCLLGAPILKNRTAAADLWNSPDGARYKCFSLRFGRSRNPGEPDNSNCLYFYQRSNPRCAKLGAQLPLSDHITHRINICRVRTSLKSFADAFVK